MRLPGKLAIAYVVALHAALAVVLVNSDFIERVGRKFGRMNDTQGKILARQDVWNKLAPEGATVFLGDSLTEGLPATAVAPNAVNFGIGGILSTDLQRNLPHYAQAMQHASRVYLMIGTNDVLRGKFAGLPERIASIVQAVPADKPLVLSSIPPSFRPVDAIQLAQVNAGVAAICKTRPGCTFVDSGQVFAPAGKPVREFFLPDDLHFTTEGYRRWVDRLRAVGQAGSGESLAVR